MAKPTQDKLIDALLAVITREGWPAATLAAIAREASCSVADVASFGNRFDLLAAFGKRTDVAALKGAEEDGGSQAPRDRLFDILMARFDALAAYKPAVRVLAKASRRDPGLAAFFACRLLRSMAVLASAAGVKTSGLMGAARVKALAGLYLSVVREWFGDDSQDMAKTMAALDKALARAHRWETQMCKVCRPSPPKSSEATAPA
jgi:ubiquinone biosynthesis protein COQ9